MGETSPLINGSVAALLFITIWLGMHGFYISLLVAGCVTLFVAYTIYRYILRSARAMAQLIWAIRYSDFLSLPAQREEHLHSLPAELWDELNEALDFYKQNLQKKKRANSSIFRLWPIISTCRSLSTPLPER